QHRHALERTPHPERLKPVLALPLSSLSLFEPVRFGEITILEAVSQLHGYDPTQRIGRERRAAHALTARQRGASPAARQHRRRQQDGQDAHSPPIEPDPGISSPLSMPTRSPARRTTARWPTGY